MYGCSELAQSFIDSGSDINIKDNAGRTTLDYQKETIKEPKK